MATRDRLMRDLTKYMYSRDMPIDFGQRSENDREIDYSMYKIHQKKNLTIGENEERKNFKTTKKHVLSAVQMKSLFQSSTRSVYAQNMKKVYISIQISKANPKHIKFMLEISSINFVFIVERRYRRK